MSNIDNILERVGFNAPQTLLQSDYSSYTKIENILNVPKTEYLSGDVLRIGTKTLSNELTDFRNSYLIFLDTVAYSTTLATNSAFLASKNANPYAYPILSSGLPFNRRTERVNGDVVINHCGDRFNRYSTLNMIASGAGNDNTTVFNNNAGATVALTAGLWGPNGCRVLGNVGVTTWGLSSKAYSTLISGIGSRLGFASVSISPSTTTIYNQWRTVILPLDVISRLGSSSNYIPTGLMSQTNTHGWTCDLTIAPANQIIMQPQNTSVDVVLASIIYKLRNPRLVTRVVKINNPQLLSTYINDYNMIDRVLQLGDREVRLNKNILVPFNNSEYVTTRVSDPLIRIDLNYNIKQKGLKGVSIRLAEPNFDRIGCEKLVGLTKSSMNSAYIKSVQLSIGSLKFPQDNLHYNVADFYANVPYQVFSTTGNHLFDPRNIYNNGVDVLGNVNNNSWGYSVKQSSGTNSISDAFVGFTFSFENFAQIASETTDAGHDFGVNTFIHGDRINLVIEFTNPVTGDIVVETEFVYQDMLLVSNGNVSRVFNKTINNSILDVE